MLSCTSRLGRTPIRLFSTTSVTLSGHSKWSTIKHDKAKNDAEKNRVANKFANAIAVAAKCMYEPTSWSEIRVLMFCY